jgi:WD40 repeat protein
MPDLFLSYSRRDKEFVRKLFDALKAQERDVWVDWEDIPLTADWMKEIEEGIETSDNFVFVISPDSVASEVCGKEVAYALTHNKRLVPILWREITDPEHQAKMHKSLSAHNWIYMREQDNFDESFNGLIKALDTDLSYVRYHTALTKRALEWRAKNKNRDLLLRGSELRQAELWLATSQEKDPRPTDEQSEYVHASRLQEIDSARRQITFLMVGFIGALLLAIFAIVQYFIAEDARRQAHLSAQIALSRQLSAQAVVRMDDDLQTALLLSVEANIVADRIGFEDNELLGTLVDSLQVSPRLITFLHGHTDSVFSLWVHPNGNILASCSLDGTVIFWDLQTHQPIGEPLQVNDGGVRAVAFSPDGNLLAVGADHLTLWDVRDVNTPQHLGEPISAGESGVTTLAYAPDGTMVAAGLFDGTVRLWNITDPNAPQAVFTLSEHKDRIIEIAISADGTMLASASQDSSVRLWNLADGTQIRALENQNGRMVTVSFSPDSTRLAAGGADTNIYIWNIADLRAADPAAAVEPALTYTAHTTEVTDLIFSPDGTLLASGGGDQVLILWDTTGDGENDARRVPRLVGHSNWINAVVFTPDSRYVMSASDDFSIAVWDARRNESLGRTLYSAPDNVLFAAYSPDASLIAASQRNGVVILLDAANGGEIGRFEGHTDDVEDLVFTPDGTQLITSSVDQTVRIWDVASRTLLLTLTGAADDVIGVAVSPDGRIIAAGDIDGRIHLWDRATGAPLREPLIGDSRWVKALAFTPDGTSLITGGRDGYIRVWNTSTWELRAERLEHNRGIRQLVVNADGTLLASSSLDESIILWDTSTWQPLSPQVYGHNNRIDGLAFSPDGRYLASGSLDSTDNIALWSVSQPQVPERIGTALRGHIDGITALAFDPNDSSRLLSASYDNTLIEWTIDPDQWLIQACETVNRTMTDLEWRTYIDNASIPREVCPIPTDVLTPP